MCNALDKYTSIDIDNADADDGACTLRQGWFFVAVPTAAVSGSNHGFCFIKADVAPLTTPAGIKAGRVIKRLFFVVIDEGVLLLLKLELLNTIT